MEALNIQLDNVRLKLQVLQVENAKLREANPKASLAMEAERRELEELRQNLHKARSVKYKFSKKRTVSGRVAVG